VNNNYYFNKSKASNALIFLSF